MRGQQVCWCSPGRDRLLTSFSACWVARFGEVDGIKLLPRARHNGARAAFVDFVDVASASRAVNNPPVMSGVPLRVDYNTNRGRSKSVQRRRRRKRRRKKERKKRMNEFK